MLGLTLLLASPLLLVRGEASSPSGDDDGAFYSPTKPTPLALGGSVRGSVATGTWINYITTADSDDQAIAFHVVAESTVPTALEIYVYDNDYAIRKLDGVALGPSPATAIDADTASTYGNGTVRHFYAYVAQCYLMVNQAYTLMVKGNLRPSVAFTVYATRVQARLDYAPDNKRTGSVCDGRYMHYFWDLPVAPTHGGIEVAVRKTSGELDSFYLRKERCAGVSGTSIGGGNLFGHGLSGASTKLPTEETVLDAGRYYVSVRGAAAYCGDYEIRLRNLTVGEVAELVQEVEVVA